MTKKATYNSLGSLLPGGIATRKPRGPKARQEADSVTETCRVCGQKLSGEVRFDPTGSAYIHPHCMDAALDGEAKRVARIRDAAPELLAALKRLEKWASAQPVCGTPEPVLAARAAISKAENHQ